LCHIVGVDILKPKKKDPKKVGKVGGGNAHITIVGMIFVLVKFLLEVSF
jgi:hypothetical protein